MTMVRASRGAHRPEIYSFVAKRQALLGVRRGFAADKGGQLPPALRAGPAASQIHLEQGRDRTFLIDPLDCLAKQWRD